MDSRATLSAVAAEVGVSRTTVSNAYNRPDQLSPQLRQRILEVAERLGYAGPDPVARSLRIRRASAIGLIFTEQLGYAFRDPGAFGFLEGVADGCEQQGLSLLLVPASSARSVSSAESTDAVARAAVDGFIVYSMPTGDPHVRAALARRRPTVVVDSPGGLADVDFVGIDDRGAFSAITAHVLSLGHRRIGVVSMDTARARQARVLDLAQVTAGERPVMSERLVGIRDAISAAGAGSALVALRPAHERSEGALGAAALLDRDSALTAILCISDVLALGVLDELDRRGLGVPDDISVTGFDDIPEAAVGGLTTVRQPMADKGRAAVDLVVEEAHEARRLLMPTSVVVRSSVARPRVF